MRSRFVKAVLAAILAAAMLPPAGALAFSLGGLFGSPVDAELAAQVPQDKRKAINDADYALACANQDVELAKLKEELADKQDDLAAQRTKLAKSDARAAQIAFDIARQQGIMDSGLGKAEDNQKIMNDLQADRIKNQAERTDIQAKADRAMIYVRDWTQRVADKEKSVAEFKSRRGGGEAAKSAAAKPADAARPVDAAKPAADPTVIIREEPGAAQAVPAGQPAPAAATPESDLKN